MDVAKKLQIKPEHEVCVAGPLPDGVDLGLEAGTEPAKADAVITFVRDRAELDAQAAPVLEAARRDALAWFAYPKGGRLGTDLNRDLLAEAVNAMGGVRPVRQVSINDTWSALRFRPA